MWYDNFKNFPGQKKLKNVQNFTIISKEAITENNKAIFDQKQ